MSLEDRSLTVYETYLRSEKGIKMPENHWDNKIVPENASMLKEKYQIKFDSVIIPTDKESIKNLFLAGLEMLVTTGIYNADTGKVIKVTESEVKEGIKRAPKKASIR